jgi:signal transduction histidine kinase
LARRGARAVAEVGTRIRTRTGVGAAVACVVVGLAVPRQRRAVRLVRRPRGVQSVPTLGVALAELRELTHGINAPLLTERGLPAALDELCRRAALSTHLNVTIDQRLPDQIETAAYFMVSEALTNAAKHSHGTEIQVLASHRGKRLTIEIGDDGIGSATPTGGSGLRGLADRVEALGGRLTISSPPGRGTTLRAEIPCA